MFYDHNNGSLTDIPVEYRRIAPASDPPSVASNADADDCNADAVFAASGNNSAFNPAFSADFSFPSQSYLSPPAPSSASSCPPSSPRASSRSPTSEPPPSPPSRSLSLRGASSFPSPPPIADIPLWDVNGFDGAICSCHPKRGRPFLLPEARDINLDEVFGPYPGSPSRLPCMFLPASGDYMFPGMSVLCRPPAASGDPPAASATGQGQTRVYASGPLYDVFLINGYEDHPTDGRCSGNGPRKVQ
ncbi:hypothetical protein BDK51DRAFT_40451 [Blyttiomyces helicus]|uniref:Uncharacterized protein n=1 Tax=Blyttiomyces helicus TaxID=388810 RepID=A0A4P9W9Y6_9FUNG|nr:hypothetical protein BDK51DRAFT_40451 [Blyttiomyces helicus]|eukprot:RKO87958.1 hypothetical protein BDK51DRAFT_40451 [Blyttiomyces helicus]